MRDTKRKTLKSDLNLITNLGWKKMKKETGLKIDYKTYSTVVKEINEHLLEKASQGRYCVRIPEFLFAKVIKVKPYGKVLNLKSFLKDGSYASMRFVTNSGYMFKLQVYFYESRNWPLECYTFQITERAKRNLVKRIENNELQGI